MNILDKSNMQNIWVICFANIWLVCFEKGTYETYNWERENHKHMKTIVSYVWKHDSYVLRKEHWQQNNGRSEILQLLANILYPKGVEGGGYWNSPILKQ